MTVTEFPNTTKKGPAAATADPKLRERLDRARAWLAAQYSEKKTWAKVAKEVGGYEEASIGLFANDKYTANPERILLAVEKAMELKADRDANVFKPELAETSIARRIRRAMRQTRLRSGLGLISGQSGVGKTTALLAAVAADPQRTGYMRANPTMRGRIWCVTSSLMSALGQGSGKRSTPSHLYDALVQYLLTTRRMVVIDEVQFLSRDSLDMLRTLSEDADIPILFSGNETVHEFGMLTGSNPAAYTQFVSRCSVQENFRVSDITRGDVDLIAAQLLDDAVLEEVGDDLLAQAHAPGGFRRLRDILQRAHERTAGKRASINANQIYAAIKDTQALRGIL
jgi:DNA transposition AAA+ family ATPase